MCYGGMYFELILFLHQSSSLIRIYHQVIKMMWIPSDCIVTSYGFNIRYAPLSPVALCEQIFSFLIYMHGENDVIRWPIEFTFSPKRLSAITSIWIVENTNSKNTQIWKLQILVLMQKINTLGRLSNEYNNNRHNWHDQHLVIRQTNSNESYKRFFYFYPNTC
jgi:hypothetical protein